MSNFLADIETRVFSLSKAQFEAEFWYLFLKNPSNGPSTGQQCAAAVAQSRLDLLPVNFVTLEEALERLSHDFEILAAIRRYSLNYVSL